MFQLIQLFIFFCNLGVQLDAKNKEIEWDPEKTFPKDEKEGDGMPIPRHSLMIKQVCFQK